MVARELRHLKKAKRPGLPKLCPVRDFKFTELGQAPRGAVSVYAVPVASEATDASRPCVNTADEAHRLLISTS